MVRLLVWMLLGYVVYRMMRGKGAMAPEKGKGKGKDSAATETFKDPVCGVYVSQADAVVGKLEGKRYHFCSLGCLQQFEKNLQQR